MTKMRKLIVGALVLSLLAVGLVAIAGNGFGGKGTDEWAAARGTGECSLQQSQDSDGDGILNCEDEDWTRPLDGTGFKHMQSQGEGLRDGSGNKAGNGVCDGSGNGKHNRRSI